MISSQFERSYRPKVLQRAGWAVIIWHDPRTAWYGVVMADGNVAPMMSGDVNEVEHAARKALGRLCGEAE